MHAGEEGVAPGGAALLGVVGHEDRAFVADLIDVRRLADHQAAVVDARLHPADVVTHDEEDVGLPTAVALAAARPRARSLLLWERTTRVVRGKASWSYAWPVSSVLAARTRPAAGAR